MKTVLAFGSFDILHYGHLQFLSKAKGLGDRLVVVVARDATMRRLKGREPIFDEDARLAMISALKIVDEARLGNTDGADRKYDIILEVKPQVIALGYDQEESEGRLGKWLESKGMGGTKIVRIKHVEDEEVFKSSKAIDRIRSSILKEV